MSTVGEYLRDVRNNLGHSMDNVKDNTGITDSRLCRIENGKFRNPPAQALKLLADFYGLDLIDLYVRAGYLNQEQIEHHQHDFTGVESLSSEEKKHIQQQIDFLIQRRGQKEVTI